MSTTVTPPPAPTPVPDARPPQRSAPRVVSILAMALGGVVLLGTIGWAVVSTVATASVETSVRTLAVAGVEELDVEAGAGSLRIEFADVDEAELQVTSFFGGRDWTLSREGSTLTVETPRRFGPAWLFGGNGTAVLRLPISLRGVDADLTLSAGELTADGSFGSLDLQVGAGRAEIAGSARAVSADVNAGRADLELADVRTATLTVNAGELVATFTGEQPGEVGLDVTAGSLTAAVPRGDYRVTSEVSAGEFDDRIGSTPGATSTVDVQVSAGTATLRASD